MEEPTTTARRESKGYSTYRNLLGMRFWKLVVIGIDANDRRRALVRCDCGVEKSLNRGRLVSGKVKSCGCHRTMWTRTHGRTLEYVSYHSMLQRCLNSRSGEFDDYGGRGIAVCDRWRGKHGFAHFLTDMGTRPSVKHTLDRKDNDLGYTSDNCRWATTKQQSRNKRNTVYVEIDGVRRPVADVADEHHVNRAVFKTRLRMGWDVQRAIDTPVHSRKQETAPRKRRPV